MSIAEQLYGKSIENRATVQVKTPVLGSEVSDLLRGKAVQNSFSRGTWLRDLKVYLDENFGKVFSYIKDTEKKNRLFPVVKNRVPQNALSYQTTNQFPQMSQVEALRQQDDINKAQQENFEKAVNESKTIGKIEDSIVKLTTGAKVVDKKQEETGSGMSFLVGFLPAAFNMLKSVLGSVWKFVSGLPGVNLAIGYVSEMVAKIPKIAEISAFITKQIANVTGFLEKFSLENVTKTVKEAVTAKVAPVVESVKTFASPIIDGVTDTAKSLWSKATDLVKPAKEVGESAVTKIAPKITEEAGEGLIKNSISGISKIVEDIGLKSIIKKIPIIGTLMGIGFAVPRLLRGDYIGASMEVASGISASFPGVGTAGSIAIDTALVAKDMGIVPDPFKAGGNNINNTNSKQIIDKSTNANQTVVGGNTNISYSSSSDIRVNEDEADLIKVGRF
jgi:hypothetical protein